MDVANTLNSESLLNVLPLNIKLQSRLGWIQLIVLTLAVCIALSKLFSYAVSQKQTKQLKWFTIGLPLVGTALAFGKSPEAVLLKARKELGNVFGLNLVMKRLVIVLGPDAHRWFFNGDDGTPSRELSFDDALEKNISHLFGEGFMHLSPDWNKKSRRLIMTGWSTPARLAAYSDVIQSEVHRQISTWAQKDSIDLFRECSTLSLRIMIRALFGEEALDMCPHLATLFYEFERLGVLTEVMQFGWFPSGNAQKFRRIRQQLIETIAALVKDRYAKLEESRDRRDYLQFVLNDSPEYPDIMPTHFMALLMAGHINTAATMAWTITHILSSEPLTRQVRTDVRSPGDPFQEGAAAGDKAAAAIALAANKGELPLLDKCMRETNRMYANLLLVREVARPSEVCGVKLPKGTTVAFSPFVMHWDDTVYKDPSTFNPHRFSKPGIEELNAKKSYIPFGSGRHACPGQRMSMLTLRSAWSTLFREYDSVLLTRNVPDPEYLGALGTPLPKNLVKVRVRRKSEP